MGLSHGLVRLLQFAFFSIVLGISAYMVSSRNDEFHEHDHAAVYYTWLGVFGVMASLLGLAAAFTSSIAMSITSIVWDCILAVMFLVGAIMQSIRLKPSHCTNKNVYAHYTTTGWYWKLFDCKFTPMQRALEAFLWLATISLLATIALAIRDLLKRRQTEVIAKSQIPGYPALPLSADRADRKPKVEEVVEVV